MSEAFEPGHVPLLVVADDHTGANATAGRLASYGVDAVTVAAGAVGVPAGLAAAAVVVSTASRSLDPPAALHAVHTALEQAPKASLVAKRFDTTLRGNVGAEIDGVLRVLRNRGRPATALVVPAHPDGGRTTVGGVQLVNGQPLAATEAAADARRPVRFSRVADVLTEQMEATVAEVGIDTVRAGGEALTAALGADADVVVADAVDDGDLVALAHAAIAVSAQQGRHWLPCDPGPFTAAYADAAGILGAAAGTILAISGSVTSVTRAQLSELRRRLRTELVAVDVGDLDAAALGEAMASAAARHDVDAVVAATAMGPADVRADLDDTDAHRIAVELGRAARIAVDRGDVAGLYLTGGDVTAGVLGHLDADGLAVEREVLPLAVVGRVLGGPHAGTLAATKGGLVGDADAAARCVLELRAAARRCTRGGGGQA